MVSPERSSLVLSEYTLFNVNKKYLFTHKNQFLDESWKNLGFFSDFFQMTFKVQRFYKFWWFYRKNHIKIHQTIHFLFKKKLNLIRKDIISSEKMRNQGNYNYDYAHSLFGKDF